METAVNVYGRLDVLVNSAALDPKFDPEPGGSPNSFEELPADWNQALNVNLTGMFLCCQAAVQPMLAQGSGSIINICSTYGLVAPTSACTSARAAGAYKPVYYSVTKAGVLGMTRYLSTYYAGKNIRANALTPGGVFNNHDETFLKAYSARTVMGRMAHLHEMNGALLFLASDASIYDRLEPGGRWRLDSVVSEVLAIVPARGGSKSIPRKNIRIFSGHPLIAFSIAAGKQAHTVTRTIVSTDDEEIAEVARSTGPMCRSCARLSWPRTRPPTYRSSSRRWPGWLSTKATARMPWCSCDPPRPSARWTGGPGGGAAAQAPRGRLGARGGAFGPEPHKMWKIDPDPAHDAPLMQVQGLPEPYNAPRQILPPMYWQTGHIDAIRPAPSRSNIR